MASYSDYKSQHIYDLRPSAYAYGYSVGILQIPSRTLAIPGDIHNATTFEFPVLYHQVNDVTAEQLAAQDADLEARIVGGARYLDSQGVSAIALSSGLFAPYQTAIAAAVSVPVVSSLSLIPLITDGFLGGNKPLCMVTADASQLSEDWLRTSGAAQGRDIQLLGLGHCYLFRQQVLGGADSIDSDAVEREVADAVADSLAKSPGIKALLLESPVLPPYACAIQEKTNLPVYDLTCLLRYVHAATHQSEYSGDY